jgi:hypothetical protein
MFFLQNIEAQTIDRHVYSSNGASVKAGNIWLDYTIGEMAVVTYTTGSIVLNQGFQQVYNTTISVLNLSPSVKINVYPNPTSGRLEIDIPDEMVNNSFYKLTDITGRLISGESNSNPVLVIKNNVLNISDLPYGIYLLSIQIPDSNTSYIYRILKL